MWAETRKSSEEFAVRKKKDKPCVGNIEREREKDRWSTGLDCHYEHILPSTYLRECTVKI